MKQPLLQIKNLSKSFGKNHVLDDINLTVAPGSVVGLMGENGAGKSTMMKCLFGIYKKDEGQFFLDGKPVEFKSPKAAMENGVSMVHQELNQCLDLSVADNIFLGRYPALFGIVNEAKMFKDCTRLFQQLNMQFITVQPPHRVISLFSFFIKRYVVMIRLPGQRLIQCLTLSAHCETCQKPRSRACYYD